MQAMIERINFFIFCVDFKMLLFSFLFLYDERGIKVNKEMEENAELISTKMR